MAKTIADVVAYLRNLRSHSLERPKMYASNPDAFEDLLSLIDRLLLFIEEAPPEEKGYSQFLQARLRLGLLLQSSAAAHRLTAEDLELFDSLAEFWKAYLQSKYAV